MTFGTDPDAAVLAVRRCCQEVAAARVGRPLMVKLSPNVTDIRLMAKVAADAGVQAISLVKTRLWRWRSMWSGGGRGLRTLPGGLCTGPAIRADCGADGVRGGAAGGDSRGGDVAGSCARRMRGGVHAGWCDGGAGGHGELRRSSGGGEYREWAAAVVRAPRRGESERVDGEAGAVRRIVRRCDRPTAVMPDGPLAGRLTP